MILKDGQNFPGYLGLELFHKLLPISVYKPENFPIFSIPETLFNPLLPEYGLGENRVAGFEVFRRTTGAVSVVE